MRMSNKIRVMIVEDSRVVRESLIQIVGSDPRLEVVAAVDSAELALRVLHRVRPDVISMDIRLPGMNGFQATREIMAARPTPIVVVSASVNAEELSISMNALKSGALSVVEKPVGISHRLYQELAERLCSQLAIMSQVKVIRQRPRHRATVNAGGKERAARVSMPAERLTQPLEILGIVASTGGPKALQTLLAALPADFRIPVLIVQHITPSFQAGFVRWLNDICLLDVQEAQDGEIPEAGKVYLAPADHHLRFLGDRLVIDRDAAVCGERPSGTVLFESLARNSENRALGVLLTGMGRDGASGLLAIRQAGGYTIAEDASTAVVYGMPGAAVELDAQCESLPLPNIGPRILELCSRNDGFPRRMSKQTFTPGNELTTS